MTPSLEAYKQACKDIRDSESICYIQYSLSVKTLNTLKELAGYELNTVITQKNRFLIKH